MKEKTIKKNILWNSIGSTSYLFFQWLITVLVARLLSFEDAGVFSLAMSTTNIFTCIALYGVRNFQVSDIDNKYSDRTYIKSRVITCICAIVICTMFVLLQPFTLIQKSCIVIYMVFRASESYADVLHGIDQKAWRLDIAGKSFFIRGISMFILAVLLMISTRNLFITIITMTIVTSAVIFIYDINKTKIFISNNKVDKGIKHLLYECFPLAIYLLMSNAMGSIPRMFLERICGTEMLGIYASIASPTLIVQVLASLIFTPFIGLFAVYISKSQKTQFVKLFRKLVVIIIAISLASIVLAFLLGDFLLEILFGSKILIYTNLLIPIILCTILTAFSWLLCMILTVFRDIKGLIVSNIIGLVINICLASYSINSYGMNGTSFILIFSYTVQIILLLFSTYLNYKKMGRNKKY